MCPQAVEQVCAQGKGPAALKIGDQEVELGATEERGIGVFEVGHGRAPLLVELLQARRYSQAVQCRVERREQVPRLVKKVMFVLCHLGQVQLFLQGFKRTQERQQLLFLLADNRSIAFF